MTTTLDVTAHSQSKLGLRYRDEDSYEVGREKVREYARAVQDRNQAHWDEAAAAELGLSGLITPTTFMSIPAMMANRRLFEKILVGYEAFVQTDQVFEFYAPVVSGDRVTTDVELSGVRNIAGKDLLTVTNTFTDEADRVVQVMHTTVAGLTGADVEPGIRESVKGVLAHGLELDQSDEPAVIDEPAPVGPVATDSVTRTSRTSIRFDDAQIGAELPPRIARVARGDLVNYAGVAGDANPIHWNDDIAIRIGLPGVIAHGMLTIGYCAGFVNAWSGDPAALTKFTARLSNTVLVDADDGSEIEYTGKIKSLDPESRSALVAISAKSGGKKIFGLATATVRLS
ncbi:fused (3R)-hydroxyacyl-ACP dehydratase subunits HadA/HadB [Skermania piniformis]|uniref:MaoC family dehydratase N-terminal domain-containing protein n=1 Tax=Skermania pinensis TaxID=39122 RepID=A0ABX8SB82_9ACTN|nr:fused (3R)-hydroxyacyl-ACP dehydratase subunits HadA/HadB [Skermania piniformis]QXQ15115.1 MaoC family dehydratase N-terminal domain-containing protein [Skermania piniformis]